MCPGEDISAQVDTKNQTGHSDGEVDCAKGVEGLKGLSKRLALCFGQVWTEMWWARDESQNCVGEDEG